MVTRVWSGDNIDIGSIVKEGIRISWPYLFLTFHDATIHGAVSTDDKLNPVSVNSPLCIQDHVFRIRLRNFRNRFALEVRRGVPTLEGIVIQRGFRQRYRFTRNITDKEVRERTSVGLQHDHVFGTCGILGKYGVVIALNPDVSVESTVNGIAFAILLDIIVQGCLQSAIRESGFRNRSHPTGIRHTPIQIEIVLGNHFFT